MDRATRAWRHGALETAEQLSLDVLELSPGQGVALGTLYEIRKSQGHAMAAEALLRRLVAVEPNNLAATLELARMLLGKGALAEAEVHARNAVRMAPENPEGHNLMGMILTEAHRPQFGEHHYAQALALSGARDPIVLANLAWCLRNQGKMERARSLYEESLCAAPDVLQTLLGFSRLEEADRNLDAATALLDRAERVAPGHPGVALTRATVLGRQRRGEAALAILDGLAAPAGEARLGPGELLEKGRLLDQMGRHDEAFAAFDAGKQLLRELTGQEYLAAPAADLAARLGGFFTAGRLAILPRAGVRADGAQPLFILGFPRSGTTLVEQTLSVHPRIAACDELPVIGEITQIMPRVLDSPLPYPEALSELWMADHRDDLDTLRDYYLHKARLLGAPHADAAWFTDKMPLNEMHLGLIALLFPRSPLIHVLRHPLDVVLSVYSNLLTHGFFCAYALESIARHFVLVGDLVEQYRAEMGLRYLPVRYEDLVDDQEGGVRRMLDFVGEAFDPRCLAFHENRRYARTASYAQVSEPLYDRSRFRHLRYRRHLEAIVPILRPTIERLGYAVP